MPCPCCSSRCATGTVTDTTPVKFVSTISTAAAPSTSAAPWSPSTPNATSTTSKSPNRSNVVATNDSCVAKSVASNATVSTAVAPAARIAAIVSVRSSGLRAASTTRARRRRTSASHVARAMSEPPPRTRIDCTDPSASFMRRCPPCTRRGRAGGPCRCGGRGWGPDRPGPRATGRASDTSPAAARVRDARSLVKYTRPPASATSRSSPSSSSPSSPPRAGMSSASVHPSIGKPSGPSLECSKRLSTARNEAQRAALSRSSVVRTTASAP